MTTKTTIDSDAGTFTLSEAGGWIGTYPISDHAKWVGFYREQQQRYPAYAHTYQPTVDALASLAPQIQSISKK
ncbi:hypothetical protein [Rhizobiales bacterium 3FA27D7]|jgi:hypothetical protein|uniref:hypothetical protein n=1 Tax=Mesorhizobium sp. 2RAF21 TaxID=3232995 RepID=UPI0010F5398B